MKILPVVSQRANWVHVMTTWLKKNNRTGSLGNPKGLISYNCLNRCFLWNDGGPIGCEEREATNLGYKIDCLLFCVSFRKLCMLMFAIYFPLPFYSWCGQLLTEWAALCTCAQGWTCGEKYGRILFTLCATIPQSKISIPPCCTDR